MHPGIVNLSLSRRAVRGLPQDACRTKQRIAISCMLRVVAARLVGIRLIAVICSAAACAIPLAAQSTSNADSTRATLRLTVVAEQGAPVPNADVQLRRERATIRARTDSVGLARVELPSEGIWRATVRRVGFGPADVDLRVGVGENAHVVHLDRASASLDAVRVVANRTLSARLDDFEMRRLRGDPSSTITMDAIAKRNPIALSQMLRGVSGIRIADSSGSIVAVSMRGAKAERNRGGIGFGLVPCVMRITIDGVVMPALSNIDQMVPSNVYGVEIYNGPARLPPQFGGLRTDNWCGLIAIWTRDQ